MNEKNFNKLIYAGIGVILAIVLIVVICTAVSNKKTDTADEGVGAQQEVVYNELTEATVSEIDEGKLPSKGELADAGIEGVMQTSKINQQFNLRDYEVLEDGGIKYNYQASAVTNGERLSITAVAMSQEEYNDMLPKAKTQTTQIGEQTATFNDRSLYYTTDESAEIPTYIQKAEEADNCVIRYGNSLSELLPMQQLMWYSEAEGIAYTLESIARTYTADDMVSLAQDFINNAE